MELYYKQFLCNSNVINYSLKVGTSFNVIIPLKQLQCYNKRTVGTSANSLHGRRESLTNVMIILDILHVCTQFLLRLSNTIWLRKRSFAFSTNK